MSTNLRSAIQIYQLAVRLQRCADYCYRSRPNSRSAALLHLAKICLLEAGAMQTLCTALEYSQNRTGGLVTLTPPALKLGLSLASSPGLTLKSEATRMTKNIEKMVALCLDFGRANGLVRPLTTR